MTNTPTFMPLSKKRLRWYQFEANMSVTTLQARQLVLQSNGIEQTRALAQDYSEKAMAAIADFPPSEAKDGLIDMAEKTIKRRS